MLNKSKLLLAQCIEIIWLSFLLHYELTKGTELIQRLCLSLTENSVLTLSQEIAKC